MSQSDSGLGTGLVILAGRNNVPIAPPAEVAAVAVAPRAVAVVAPAPAVVAPSVVGVPAVAVVRRQAPQSKRSRNKPKARPVGKPQVGAVGAPESVNGDNKPAVQNSIPSDAKDPEKIVSSQTDRKSSVKWYNHHKLTTAQHDHLKSIIPIEWVESDSLSCHSHPISNGERRRAEWLAHDLLKKTIKSGNVMDVGGNARRNQSRPWVHCAKPVIEPADVVRRLYDEGKYCSCMAQTCKCLKFAGASFVHSHYYISASDFVQILQNCGGIGVVVCYAFPYFAGRQSYGESKYTVLGDVVTQRSPDRIYKHPTGHYVFDGYVGEVEVNNTRVPVTLCSSVMDRVGSTYILLCALHYGKLELNPISSYFDHTARDFVGTEPFVPGDMLIPTGNVPLPFNRKMYNELLSRVGMRTRDLSVMNSTICSMYVRWSSMEYTGQHVKIGDFRRATVSALTDGLESSESILFELQEESREHNQSVKNYGQLYKGNVTKAYLAAIFAIFMMLLWSVTATDVNSEQLESQNDFCVPGNVDPVPYFRRCLRLTTSGDDICYGKCGWDAEKLALAVALVPVLAVVVASGSVMLASAFSFAIGFLLYCPVVYVAADGEIVLYEPHSVGTDREGHGARWYHWVLIFALLLMLVRLFTIRYRRAVVMRDHRFTVVNCCREGMQNDIGGDYSIVEPSVPRCRGRVVAVCDTITMEKRPVFLSNCAHNQRAAIESRFDIPRHRLYRHDSHLYFAKVLKEYLAVISFHLSTVHTTFVEWIVDRAYPVAYKRKLTEAYEKACIMDVATFRRAHCHNEIFVKSEASASNDCKPRLISGKTDVFKVVTCPFFQRFTKLWAEWSRETKFCSACGLTAQELGEVVFAAVAHHLVNDYVLVEIDYSKWESSDTGKLLDVEVAFFKQMASEGTVDCPDLLDAALESIKHYKGYSKCGLVVEGPGIRASGGGETSCANGFTNIALYLGLLLTYVGYPISCINDLVRSDDAVGFKTFDSYCWVNGDDNLLLVPRHFAKWIAESGVTFLQQAGFRPKIHVREVYDWGSEAIFCSGRFYFDDELSNHTWIPKIGRVLFKSFWKPVHMFVNQPSGYYTKMVLESMVAFKNFPIIRALFSRFVDAPTVTITHNSQYIAWNKHNQHKMGVSQSIAFDDRAVEWVCQVYGVTASEIEDLEMFILKIESLPVVLPESLVHKYFEVDYEPDDSGKVGSYLEEGAPLFNNAFE